jgi:tetratricopeptide (TPR) repeat protein
MEFLMFLSSSRKLVVPLLALLLAITMGRTLVDRAQINLIAIALVRSLPNGSNPPISCPAGKEYKIPQRIASISFPGRLPPSLPTGMTYWMEGNCEAAANEWLRLAQSQPYNRIAWLWLGIAEANLGHLESAAEAIRSARAEVYIVRQAMQANNSRDTDRTRLWLTVAAKTGRASPLVYRVAWKYYEVGQRNDALAFLQPFNDALPPNTIDSLRTLGMIERVKGNISEAVRFYELALQISPDDLDLLPELRSIMLDTGNYKRGLEIALREAELAPPQAQAQAEARLTVAWVYRLLQDYPNARQWALRAQEANPNWWPVYTELGTINCLDRHDVSALDYFNKALELSPNQLDVLMARGQCLHTLGNRAEAIQSIEQLIDSYGNEPKLIDVYLLLGQWYTDAGEMGLAENLYRRGLQLWPQAHWLQSRLDELQDE